MRLLEEDWDLIDARIAELKAELKTIAPKLHEALNQSSETYHDNAPFDVVKNEQAIIEAQIYTLSDILSRGLIVKDDPVIGKNHTVKVKSGDSIEVFVVGDFSLRVGDIIGGALVVSVNAPVCRDLIG